MSLHKLFTQSTRWCTQWQNDRQVVQTRSTLMSLSIIMTLAGLSLLSLGSVSAQTPTVTTPAPVPVTEPKVDVIPSSAKTLILPGTSAHEIAEVAQTDLGKLLSEGPCPCDPKQTLLQCIQAQSCPAATALAEFGVQKYKEGMSSDQVAEAVINKFIADFTPPAEFDLSKTAFKGSPNAPITIVEFADFECPHCSLMAGIMSEVIKARPQAVKLYFKQFPLPFHQLAPLASRATIAAHKQGAFWPMHDLIFSQQENLKESSFIEFAEQLGLNLMVFRADFASEEVSQQVESEKAEGAKAGLQGTPTLYFNGKMYRGEPNKEAILAHIDGLLVKLKTEQATQKSPN